MKTIFLRGIFCFCISLTVTLFANEQDNTLVVLDDLRCCNMLNPDGIDSPLLSWKIKTMVEGISQKAWEVEIATKNEMLLKDKAVVCESGN